MKIDPGGGVVLGEGWWWWVVVVVADGGGGGALCGLVPESGSTMKYREYLRQFRKLLWVLVVVVAVRGYR